MTIRNFIIPVLLLVAGAELSFGQSQSEIDSGFDWYSLSEAQQKAEQSGKKILLFGYAEWCTYCLKMRKQTFPDEKVLAAIEEYYIPVQLNGESEEEVKFNDQTLSARELARFLRLSSFPTHYFIDSKGAILGAQPGFIEAEVYAPLLDYVGSGAYGSMSFDEFIEKEN